jgi:pimeloyl-ACP methyl ester carboxylesterase
LDGLDLRSRLAEVDLPALIINGTADTFVPVADAQAMAAGLPNAAHHLIPGAGHVPTMTCPAEVAAAIDGYFVE